MARPHVVAQFMGKDACTKGTGRGGGMIDQRLCRLFTLGFAAFAGMVGVIMLILNGMGIIFRQNRVGAGLLDHMGEPVQRLDGKFTNAGRLNAAIERAIAHDKDRLAEWQPGNLADPGIAPQGIAL